MINLVIVSKDRPCQASSLLESIDVFCKDVFNINVLYVSSSKEFSEGFEVLKADFPQANYIEHKNGEFKENLLSIYSSDLEHVAFSTEDTLIYRDNNFGLIEERMEDVSVFSIRYGLNTVMQHEFENRYQPPLSDYNDEGETISWLFERYHPLNNYGFPMGLDMHVYHRDEFSNLCRMIDFDRPTELETGLFKLRHMIKPKIRSFKQSSAVNIPLSNLTGVTLSMETDTEFLNREYLSGKRLSYIYDKDQIIGCHQILGWTLA